MSKRQLEFESNQPPQQKKSATTPVPTVSPTSYTNIDAVTYSPSKIKNPATIVDVCAMMTYLSPIRNKHFTGELVDEETSVRLVGFEIRCH